MSPEPDDSDIVSSRIRAAIALLRNVSGDSQEALGVVLGVSRAVIGQRLDGRTRFTAAEVATAATHYKVPIEAIYGGPDACLRALATAEVPG